MLVSAKIALGPSCKTWHTAQFLAQNRVKYGISNRGRELWVQGAINQPQGFAK